MGQTTILLDGIELEVEYIYTPPARGSRDSLGEPLEPDDIEDFEVISVKSVDNFVDLLTFKQLDDIIEEIKED